MLNDTIREYRRQKGYSQETLAQQLHVVRQTVSKWESGLSVPDAEMLTRLSEVLEVPVSVLLGEYSPEEGTQRDDPYSEIAKQLAILNDQLAAKSRRRRKGLLWFLVGLVLLMVLYIGAFVTYKTIEDHNRVLTRAEIVCTLSGESYGYEVLYDQNFRVLEAGGDGFIAFHVQPERFDDANVLLAQIEDYFTARGGTVTVTRAPEN